MKTKIRLSISALALFAAVMATAQDAPENEVYSLDAYLITAATRTERSASTLPQTVDVLPSHEFADQLAISTDPIQGLAWLIPSYAPSRQKITGLGETLRGREPLFLIDGIPQSNPLRNGSRDGYTIDPIMIEQIEVINGASASQGLGATGGIINYVTRRAPSNDGVEHEFESGINSSNEFSGDGIGYRAAYATGARSGNVGVVGALSYEWRGMSYDGDGRRIGVDNTQGDTQYSATWDLYGKVQYDLNAQQSITFFINHFNMEQELEYVQVPGNHALDIPTTSIRGTTEGRPARNEVTTAGLTYRHAELAGGTLTVDGFYQDFAATYGGGKFIDFQIDPTVASSEYLFDQSQNESEKKGIRVTYAKTIGATGLVTGLDHLRDGTRQILVHSGQVWVPETTYLGWSPFLQLEHSLGPVSLTAGLRHERAELDVGDFVTLPYYGRRFDADGTLIGNFNADGKVMGTRVGGGSPQFDENLLNVGATWTVSDQWTLYGSFSQGFGMPDVGRVLRGISTDGEDIDDYLNLEPIVTDNYEIGLRFYSGRWQASLAGFRSYSEFGSRLQLNADNVFDVIREENEIYGFEGSLDFKLSEADRLGGSFAWIEGKSDTNGDGTLDRRLSGLEIPAPKLILHWTRQMGANWQGRLQAMMLFDREDPRGRAAFDFDGYALVDALLQYRMQVGTLSMGVENLFDTSYITHYSQTSGNNSRVFAGRGRTLSLKFRVDF